MVWSAVTEGTFINKQVDKSAKGAIASKSINTDVTTQPKDVVLSKRDNAMGLGHTLPSVDTPVLLGRTFINDPDEKGEQVLPWIKKVKPLGRTTPDRKQELFQFRARAGEQTFKNIMTYNKMLEWCNRDLDKDDLF